MRRILSLCLLVLLLAGCKNVENPVERGISFRSQLISSGGCRFRAQITADYGTDVQNFTLSCVANGEGEISFCVLEPDTISDITGTIEGEKGIVTYDGLQLSFPLLVYDRISPVSAPALAVDCWLKEYILSAGYDQDVYRITYEKKIQNDDLLIDTYFEKDIPIFVELCYNGYRIIHIQITDFTFL